MKPCKNCPFLSKSPLGLWHPVEYLLVAYLGSVQDFVELRDLGSSMGCHQYNGITQEKPAGESPRCGGWLRAAKGSFTLQMQARMGKISEAELAEMEDGTPVMSPEELAAANGLDLEWLPPLRWRPGDPRYPTPSDWMSAIQDLRAQLREEPELAYTFVVPGSPLDRKTKDEDIRRAFGEAALQRYKARERGRNGLEV